MLLKEIFQSNSILIVEGGNAFTNVGAIHVSEIQPTLAYVSKAIGLSDVNGRVLGSVGKKEYSGDIDIAVEPQTPQETAEFIDKLVKAFGTENVRKVGALVTTSIPIQGFDKSKDGRQPRTGRVQTDFIFGNPEWLKFYYHSPSSAESTLKGMHRNAAIRILASFVDREASDDSDDQKRPVRVVRWKWSPKVGLVKVERTSRKKANGAWLKKQDEKELSEPVSNPNDIAKILFKGKADASALNSAESIIAAVKKSYPKELQQQIFAKMAEEFETIEAGEKYDWPPELKGINEAFQSSPPNRPVTQSELNQLERYLDALYAADNIDFEFTRHFLDRVNDTRNRKQITTGELFALFGKAKMQHARDMKQTHDKEMSNPRSRNISRGGGSRRPGLEAVITDINTKLNSPFVLSYDPQSKEFDLFAKSVMRKDQYGTSNPRFTVK